MRPFRLLAIVFVIRFCSNSTLQEAAYAQEVEAAMKPSIEAKMTAVKSELASRDSLEVTIVLQNSSASNLTFYNSDFHPLLADRAAAIILTDERGTVILNLFDRPGGSFISPRASDWQGVPAGQSVTSNFKISIKKVQARGKILPGKYFVQLQVHAGFVGENPWRPEERDLVNYEPQALRTWQRNLPGKVIATSERLPITIVD